MKKTLLTVLLMAFSVVMAMAQDSQWVEAQQVTPKHEPRTISGTLLDKESKEPVLQATIQLLKATDSTYVAGAVSDENGAFSLKAPDNGKYIIKMSNVGYKTITRNITIADNKDFAFGKVNMETDAVLLKEVVANGIAAKVIVKEDTFIYNAAAYRTPEGSVIEELVKRLPGAQIDDSGNITINGKQVKKVKVDGKEFMTGDTQTALKNLPTAIIEKVKAYDEKSDMAKMTGVDDGEENTVLDFGIKKGMNKGFLSNIDLAIGTESRYAERVMAGYMKDDSRVMLFGNANNTGDRGFGGRGGFGGGGNGLQANKMIGINYNYEKKDKLRFDFSVRWNHSNTDNNTTTATESFLKTTGGVFSNSKSQSYGRSNSWNMQANVEWKPDTMWTIQVRPNFTVSSSDSRSQNQNATFNQDPNTDGTVGSLESSYLDILNDMYGDSLLVNGNQSSSLSYSTSTSFNMNATINRKLSSRGNNLTFQGRIGKGTGDSESLNMQHMHYYQLKDVSGNDSAYYRNRYSLTPSNNWNFQTALSYSERLSKFSFLVLKYTYKYSNRENTRSTYDFSKINGFYQDLMPEFRDFNNYVGQYQPLTNNELICPYYVDTLSRHTEYDNYIHEIELTWRRTTQKYNLNLGVMFQPQSQQLQYKGQDLNPEYANTGVEQLEDRTIVAKRSVFNVSPTLDFRYKWTKQKSIRLNFRSSTDQPSMTDMLPIIDDSDPMNITKGNPNLKPSFTQNFSLRFNNYVQSHFSSVMSFINFSNTQNSVSNKVTYNDLTGGRTTQPENINGNWNINGAFMYNTALDTAGVWNVSTFTNARFVNSVNYVTLAQTDAYSNNIYRLNDGSNRTAAIDKSGYIIDENGNQTEKYTGSKTALYDEATKNYTHSTTLSERLGISYRNSWLEVELNGSVDYNINRNTLVQNSNLDTWNFTYGTDITVTAPWGTGFSTSAHMSSRRGYNSAEANTNEFLWNVQVSQSFLTGKPLTLSVQFYDLLHQKSSFSRNIDASSRRDTWSNSINNYIMFHAIYRFNAFGGKDARQAMRNGRNRDRNGGPDGDRGPGDGPGGGGPGGGPGGGGPRGGMGGGGPM